ncbi:hypothetical protein [Paenibacillus popilliae]|uniref:Uncharacterized conserved protein n=1 Tax=Paenibacillus popilliae ATCC 14706 TaxID=1212764 RepID=M9M274_PAEPP|nr:hypothetical protein [Paenibacillus popilliae]GAC41213.1 uncharacterized conserved protein [Paenibacillus popilliae ATCC 14706]
MKSKKLLTVSLAVALMMVMSQSAFATKVTITEKGTTIDTTNNGSGHNRTEYTCYSKCKFIEP